MRQKLFWILGIEAVVCVILCILQHSFSGWFSSLMAFPFEQIGVGLRALSLSGTPGNIAAIVIYLAVCISPLIYCLMRRKQRSAADSVLLLTSLLLFVCMYFMINPAKMPGMQSPDAAQIGKAALGAMVYMTLILYLVLRMTRGFSDEKKGLRYLGIILTLFCVVLVFSIFGAGPQAIMQNMQKFNSENAVTSDSFGLVYGGAPELALSRTFIVLQGLSALLPNAMELLIIFSALGLIAQFKKDAYGAGVGKAAAKLSRICLISVISIIVAQLAVNCLQLLMGGQILSVSFTANIPLDTLAIALVTMLLAKFFERSRQLKADNDMII